MKKILPLLLFTLFLPFLVTPRNQVLAAERNPTEFHISAWNESENLILSYDWDFPEIRNPEYDSEIVNGEIPSIVSGEVWFMAIKEVFNLMDIEGRIRDLNEERVKIQIYTASSSKYADAGEFPPNMNLILYQIEPYGNGFNGHLYHTSSGAMDSTDRRPWYAQYELCSGNIRYPEAGRWVNYFFEPCSVAFSKRTLNDGTMEFKRGDSNIVYKLEGVDYTTVTIYENGVSIVDVTRQYWDPDVATVSFDFRDLTTGQIKRETIVADPYTGEFENRSASIINGDIPAHTPTPSPISTLVALPTITNTPTQVPPTQEFTPTLLPTQAAPTQAAPTQAAPTQAAPTQAAPTQAAPTMAAPNTPTQVPLTVVPPSPVFTPALTPTPIPPAPTATNTSTPMPPTPTAMITLTPIPPAPESEVPPVTDTVQPGEGIQPSIYLPIVGE